MWLPRRRYVWSHAREGVAGGVRGRVHRPQRLHQAPMRSPSARRSSPAPAIRTMNARASGRRPLICCDRLRCRPRATPLRLDVNLLRGDRDHDAFALWVLSSSARAVCNSSLRMSQKGRALLHSGDGRDRTPTCDRWHVRVVVLVMPKQSGGKPCHTRPKSVVRTRVVSCFWWTSQSRWKTLLAAERLADRRPRSSRRYSTSLFIICASVAPNRTPSTTTFTSVCWATAKRAVNQRSAVN